MTAAAAGHDAAAQHTTHDESVSRLASMLAYLWRSGRVDTCEPQHSAGLQQDAASVSVCILYTGAVAVRVAHS
jgi:hypothetical protein